MKKVCKIFCALSLSILSISQAHAEQLTTERGRSITTEVTCNNKTIGLRVSIKEVFDAENRLINSLTKETSEIIVNKKVIDSLHGKVIEEKCSSIGPVFRVLIHKENIDEYTDSSLFYIFHTNQLQLLRSFNYYGTLASWKVIDDQLWLLLLPGKVSEDVATLLKIKIPDGTTISESDDTYNKTNSMFDQN